MRICFLSHTQYNGGAEKCLLEIIDALQAKGIDCVVLSPGEGKFTDELSALGIPFKVIPYPWWMRRIGMSPWARLKRVVRLTATIAPVTMAIRKSRCDVVYTNTATICSGAFAAFLLRRPHVWHLHEFGMEDHNLEFVLGKKLSYKIMNALSTIWIANSRAVQAKHGQHMDLAKSQVIYYSMHRRPTLEQLPPFPGRNGTFRCIIVGTLFENKGQEEAILAIAELAKRDIKVELLVVGSGNMRYQEYLKNLVQKSSLTNQVIFTGHMDNPFPAYQSADVALVCSKAEAFGRVTIEAMLAGRPVIASRSGANEELIREGFNGVLYQNGIAKDLADKIALFYENSRMAEQLGRSAKEWAETIFNKERYGNELLSALALCGNVALDTNRPDVIAQAKTP